MAIAYFEPSRLIEIDGAVYALDRMVSDKEWQLESKDTGQYITRTVDELNKLYVKRRMRFILSAQNERKHHNSNASRDRQTAALDALLFDGSDDVSTKKMTKRERKQLKKNKIRAEEAKTRYLYVKAVESACLAYLTQQSLEPVISETWNKYKQPDVIPNWVTVYRWVKRFRDGGSDIRALVSQDTSKGNRTRRYESVLLDIITQAVDTIYLSREHKTVEDVCDHAIFLVSKENKMRPKDAQLPLPTTSLVKRRISEIPAFDRAVARKGREAAIVEFRSVLHQVPTSRPLERVEVDHSSFDLMVIDDETYLPLGRPTLTVAEDVFTRCILGIYTGFEPASFYTVSQCLRHAFLPKTDFREQYPSAMNEWEPYGVPDTLVVDNGMEFHSASLESLAFSFGMTILYTPRKRPWFKGSVERVIGTINRGTAHGNPGTTYANIFDKKDYDPAKTAVIKLSTFIKVVHTWVTDIYHEDKHTMLGKRPITVWREHTKNMLVPIPADANDFDALIGAVKERVVTHKGVESQGLFYNSKELANLRLRIGSGFKATIRYNPCDLGHIYVIEPDTNRPLRVPALREDYATGVSEWQHNIFKRYASEHIGRKDIEAVAEAKERIRQLILRDMSDKRIRTRSKAKRVMHEGGQCPAVMQANSSNTHAPSALPVPNNDDYPTTIASKGFGELQVGSGGNETEERGLAPRKLKVLKS